MQYQRQVMLPFLALFATWVLLWLLKTDAGVFTPFLAAPLSTDFIGIGHFPTWFEQNIATENFQMFHAISIMRSLFAVVMGYFAYRLITVKKVVQ